MHIMSNVSGNQTIKFRQLLSITWEIFFYRNHRENEAGWLVLDLLFKKVLYEAQASGQHLSFNIFGCHKLGHTFKTKLHCLCMIFHEKYFSFYVLLTDSKFNCLLAFTSWNIGQYLYCNYLFPNSWNHKFWI